MPGIQFGTGPLDFGQPVLQALCRIGLQCAQRYGRLANPARKHIGAGVSTRVQLSKNMPRAPAYRPFGVQETRGGRVAAIACSTPSNCATSPSRPVVSCSVGPRLMAA